MITIHHTMLMLNSAPAREMVDPKMVCRKSYPGDSDTPETWVVPTRSFVPPRLTPRRNRNIARVMIRLGSPVLTTMYPLKKPIASATTSEMNSATKMFQPRLVTRIAVVRPVVPVTTPADRSNSPPIISSATATAMMPRVAAGSSQFAMPLGERKTDDCRLKNNPTAIAAAIAPISGRRRNCEVSDLRLGCGATVVGGAVWVVLIWGDPFSGCCGQCGQDVPVNLCDARHPSPDGRWSGWIGLPGDYGARRSKVL